MSCPNFWLVLFVLPCWKPPLLAHGRALLARHHYKLVPAAACTDEWMDGFKVLVVLWQDEILFLLPAMASV